MKYPAFTGTEPCTQIGVEHFYTEGDNSGWVNLDKIRAICATCPMQQPCLEWALAAPERYGIWGGTTERERTRIRRNRRMTAVSAA